MVSNGERWVVLKSALRWNNLRLYSSGSAYQSELTVQLYQQISESHATGAIRVLTLTLICAGRYHLRFRRWLETLPE